MKQVTGFQRKPQRNLWMEHLIRSADSEFKLAGKDAKPNPVVTNRDRIDTLKLNRKANIGASSLCLIETVKAASELKRVACRRATARIMRC